MFKNFFEMLNKEIRANSCVSYLDFYKIFENQKKTIETNWDAVCDEAQLSVIDRKLFWRRQFLNPYSIEE